MPALGSEKAHEVSNLSTFLISSQLQCFVYTSNTDIHLQLPTIRLAKYTPNHLVLDNHIKIVYNTKKSI
jgi:hypothetical protein